MVTIISRLKLIFLVFGIQKKSLVHSVPDVPEKFITQLICTVRPTFHTKPDRLCTENGSCYYTMRKKLIWKLTILPVNHLCIWKRRAFAYAFLS